MKIRYFFSGFDWLNSEALAEEYNRLFASIVYWTGRLARPLSDRRVLLVILGDPARNAPSAFFSSLTLADRIAELSDQCLPKNIVMVSPCCGIGTLRFPIYVMPKYPALGRRHTRRMPECRDDEEFRELWLNTIGRAILETERSQGVKCPKKLYT